MTKIGYSDSGLGHLGGIVKGKLMNLHNLSFKSQSIIHIKIFLNSSFRPVPVAQEDHGRLALLRATGRG